LRPFQHLRLPAAIFRASSFVIRFAAARRAWLRFEVDIRHGKLVGVANDVGDAAIFLDSPWCGEAALLRHVLRVSSRAASRINNAPGITNANANAKNEVIATTNLSPCEGNDQSRADHSHAEWSSGR
jgi:hypothetical protein